MSQLIPVYFGDLPVGASFYLKRGATAIDTKISPIKNPYGKPYLCGCKTAWFDNFSYNGKPAGHYCDREIVYVKAETVQP